MSFTELLLIGVGLSMDAFAVSICKGMALKNGRAKVMLAAGLYFGIFQALMPLIGYFLGSAFSRYITRYDHWVAFVLLAFIGGKMIKESFDEDDEKQDGSIRFFPMLLLAVATSIDALAVGLSFAFLSVSIWKAIAVIGVTTFIICAAGVRIGGSLGRHFKNKAELAGGIILVLIGIKILLEHLGVIAF